MAATISKTRIDECFQGLRSRGEKGLVVYLTAGDPSLEDTGRILAAVERGGADVIELGVPFSDPLADGPVIQRASERALRAGTSLKKILEHLPRWREQVKSPIVLFTYYNPILRYGLRGFAADSRHAGADGALAVDLTPEEADVYLAAMREENLDTVFLGAPTSTDERLARVAALSTGFFYLISRTGVTGERTEIAASAGPLISRARKATHLPLAVGFGISRPAHVRQVQSLAEAAVVGSAVVHAIEERYSTGGPAAIETFIRWLKTGEGETRA